MRPSLLLAAAVFALPAAALAQANGGKPDLAKAKAIVDQVCTACHGADGNSATPINPSLAGQPADYLALQLAHFKSGVRANPVMQGMSASLTPADMVALGTYFAQQRPKGFAAKDPALVTEGQRIYRGGDLAGGVPACAACHGPDGSGVPKNYPRLHLRPAEGFPRGRTRQRQRRQGRERPDHGGDREQDDGRANEGRRRIRLRAALTHPGSPNLRRAAKAARLLSDRHRRCATPRSLPSRSTRSRAAAALPSIARASACAGSPSPPGCAPLATASG
jgi:cytochrome c553